MGVLDDAIREHLELKRQHGAPEQEVQEQEQEALGAPQGAAAAPAAEAPVEEAVPVEEEPAADAAIEEPVDAEPEQASIPEPEPEPEPDFDFDSRRGDTPPRGMEPVEETSDEADDEDVLEETPDFLQETPEHDRLWFEQKPPRGFDFDEE